jgi:hypothetical protein
MCLAGNRLAVPGLAEMTEQHSLTEVLRFLFLSARAKRKLRWLVGDETGESSYNGKLHASHLKTNDCHNRHADLKGSSLLCGRRGNRAPRKETKATTKAKGTESR